MLESGGAWLLVGGGLVPGEAFRVWVVGGREIGLVVGGRRDWNLGGFGGRRLERLRGPGRWMANDRGGCWRT